MMNRIRAASIFAFATLCFQTVQAQESKTEEQLLDRTWVGAGMSSKGKAIIAEGQSYLGKNHHGTLQIGAERLESEYGFEDKQDYVLEMGRSWSISLSLGFTTRALDDRLYLGAGYGASVYRAERVIRGPKSGQGESSIDLDKILLRPEYVISIGYRGSSIGLKVEYSQYREWGALLFAPI